MEQKERKTYGIVNNSQNQKLKNEILAENGKVIEIPQLLTQEIKLENEAEGIIQNILHFDWLVFSDVFAVEYFLKILEERDFDLFELDNLRVCSFGESVSDQLRFVQLHTDVVASNLNAESIFREISYYIADVDELRKTKFLIIKAESKEIDLLELFEKENILFQTLPIYKFTTLEKKEVARLKTLLIGGAIDELLFTSVEDFLVIEEIFRGEILRDFLSEVVLSAKGEASFDFLKEKGFEPRMFIQNKRG